MPLSWLSPNTPLPRLFRDRHSRPPAPAGELTLVTFRQDAFRPAATAPPPGVHAVRHRPLPPDAPSRGALATPTPFSCKGPAYHKPTLFLSGPAPPPESADFIERLSFSPITLPVDTCFGAANLRGLGSLRPGVTRLLGLQEVKPGAGRAGYLPGHLAGQQANHLLDLTGSLGLGGQGWLWKP